MIQTLYILVAFVAFAALFTRLGLGSVAGLLVAGAVIGPFGLGLVRDVAVVAILAELGIVFLLFNVGLEIKLERLRLFGVRVYALAIAQLVLTAAAIGSLAMRFGVETGVAVVVGGALALSSTALVLQLLGDLKRTLTQLGRLAIATLLVQDLAVGPLIIAANLVSGTQAADFSVVNLVLGGIGVLVAIVVVSRFVLPRVLRVMTGFGPPELMLATTLLVVLAASWATEHAGLSAALGAFVAGLMVADTEFRHQIAADIAPFRYLLIGLFFMAVGMQIDLAVALDQAAVVAAFTLGLVALKVVLLSLIALVLRYRWRLAVELGVLLGQGSEFSFVILGVIVAGGAIGGEISTILTVSVALSMFVTLLAVAVGRNWLDRVEGAAASPLAQIDADTAEQANTIIVVGFGQVGMALTRHLLTLDMRVVVLDNDSERVRLAQGRGLPVFFGNAARPEVLRAAHVDRARLVVVALPDADVASRVVGLARRLAPETRVIARAPEESDIDKLNAAGASAIVVDSLGTAVDLAERVIVFFDADPDASEATAAE